MTAAVLPSVVILGMGGTIAAAAASAVETTTYALAHGIDAVIAAVPPLQALARLRGEQVANVSSHQIDDALLLRLARRAGELLAQPDVDGLVITHGTDTLEETAYFLHLVLKSRKPVVLLGAMRPSTALSADGPLNLLNAVKVAAAPQAAGQGVLVVMNDRIGSARHIVKTHTTATDAFAALDQGFIGSVVGDRVDFHAAPLRRHTLGSAFDIGRVQALPAVDIVYGHLGLRPHLFDAAIAAGARGIVFAATGNGSLPDAARSAAETARARGVAFVRASRVGGGAVSPGPVDAEAGTVAAGSLNPQKARLLLSLGLTLTEDREALQTIFDEH